MAKTVYLVRHAESVENEKTRALKEGVKKRSVKKLLYGLSLLGEKNLVNCPLNATGRAQAESVRTQLKQDNFFEEKGIQVALCSPLTRAKDTWTEVCKAIPEDSTLHEVVSIPIIAEKTPMERIPGVTYGLHRRIVAFETLLNEREEKILLVVGHSGFFKRLLSMERKLHNAEVFRVEFLFEETDGNRWQNGETMYLPQVPET